MDSRHTLLFCDVDGVLNVCVRDPAGMGAVLLSEASVQVVQEQDGGSEKGMCDRLRSTVNRDIGIGDGVTYESFQCGEEDKLCKVYVARLAKIIETATNDSGQCVVVLSSFWRLPEHADLVKELERQLSEELGRPFEFDDRTPLNHEGNVGQRLSTVGDYVTQYWKDRTGTLRVLMLDDFSATPVDGSWRCGGLPMDDAEDCEDFLRIRAVVGRPRSEMVHVEACVVHTYDSWVCDGKPKDQVQIGCGLTLPKFNAALDFLNSSCVPRAVAVATPASATPAFNNMIVDLANERFMLSVVGEKIEPPVPRDDECDVMKMAPYLLGRCGA